MGRKMLVASIVVLVAVIWSCLVIGVHGTALDRARRQSEGDGPGNGPFGEECPEGLYMCGSTQCVVMEERCDGKEDCSDGSDESGCPGRTTTTEPAQPADGDPGHAASAGDANTTVPSVNGTTVMTEMGGPEDDDSSTVTVAVIVVILVLAVLIAAGVFIFLRLRKRRMADYEKKTQIQMSSARNAGVYVDLTSAPPADEKEKAVESPETERLNKEED